MPAALLDASSLPGIRLGCTFFAGSSRRAAAEVDMYMRVLAAFVAALAIIGGCASPRVRSYGYKIIETDLSGDAVATALYGVINNPDNQLALSDASHKIVSRWESGETFRTAGGALTASISTVNLQDAAGTKYTIQRIHLADRPMLILIDATKTEAAINLHDRLEEALMRKPPGST